MNQLLARVNVDACNAMHAVIGMLDLLTEDPLTERQQTYIQACKASADRLLRRVQDVAELANPVQRSAAPSEFNLGELIAGVSDLMKVLAQRRSLTLEYECARANEMVVGDGAALENVLLRLLENAIRFTERGEIRISVTVQAKESHRLRAEFLVSDTGPGIPRDVILRIGAGSEELPAGLGLLIVDQLVRNMGGELSITSDAGIGSHIAFSLPFETPTAGPKACRENMALGNIAPAAMDRAPRVLIAEDSDDSYYLFETYVKDQGYRLDRAMDGADAVEKFRRGEYDLVVMDINMPVMNGYQAVKAMRELETAGCRARIPIIVLSAEEAATQALKGAVVGCSAYITKPVSKAAVLRTVNYYLTASRAVR